MVIFCLCLLTVFLLCVPGSKFSLQNGELLIFHHYNYHCYSPGQEVRVIVLSTFQISSRPLLPHLVVKAPASVEHLLPGTWSQALTWNCQQGPQLTHIPSWPYPQPCLCSLPSLPLQFRFHGAAPPSHSCLNPKLPYPSSFFFSYVPRQIVSLNDTRSVFSAPTPE